MSVFVLMVMGVSQVSGLMLASVAEWVGDVALTVAWRGIPAVNSASISS